MSAVFVTGASGIVGSAVVRHLAGRDEVVAAFRSPESAGALAEGVRSRHFDFSGDRMSAEAALDGCDRLFLMRPPAIEDVETYLFPLIDAAMRQRVRQIVFLSLQGVQANRRTPHHAVEAYLRRVGAPYTFLRPNFFMQNLSTTYADEIRDTGRILIPAGRSRTAFIDADDIGRVAATVLTRPGHLLRAYTLSGEESLSYRNVADIMTEVLGRRIEYAPLSEADYLDHLRAQGRPEDYVAVQRMIYRVVRLNVSAFPNRSVRRLTGRPATSFREFAQREAGAWSVLGTATQ